MMTRFAVDPEKLAAAVTRMEDFHNAVAATVAKTDSVMGRVSDTWDSDAADVGRDGYRRLDEGATQMRQALGQLQNFLDGARRGYTAAITGNSQMWGLE